MLAPTKLMNLNSVVLITCTFPYSVTSSNPGTYEGQRFTFLTKSQFYIQTSEVLTNTSPYSPWPACVLKSLHLLIRGSTRMSPTQKCSMVLLSFVSTAITALCVEEGGGVLLAISSQIQSSVICMNETLEAIRAIATLTHKKFITGICYHSPSAPPTFFSSLHNNIKLVHTRFPSSASTITGDFNLPNITYDYQSALLSPFLSQASDFSALWAVVSSSQVVTRPTLQCSKHPWSCFEIPPWQILSDDTPTRYKWSVGA